MTHLESDTDAFQIFNKFVFKKQISTKIVMKNTEQIVIGTTWEFHIQGLENIKVIQFALDAGLGERNSMGFGFMNLKENAVSVSTFINKLHDFRVNVTNL